MDAHNPSGSRHVPGAPWPLAPAGARPLTWGQWREWQAAHAPELQAQRQRASHEVVAFTGRELARLEFLRWLDATGRLAS